MEELLSDNTCLTCVHAHAEKEDKFGNPEYMTCTLKGKEMSIDDLCKMFG